ncbi:MAG TPA: DUF5947 family protein [Pseudonocardiaceae bacterium]|jgi:hypothetical protein|nr:DUF5947 family protein [Pseudonocardiaceae bacterium]
MTSGLRRFRAAAAPLPAPAPVPVDGPAPVAEQRCDMCAVEVSPAEHSHVVNTETRAIMCTCRGCYLLFTHRGAGGGKHRAVPERYVHAAKLALGDAMWESAGIPVGMAFFFTNSELNKTVAFYPSPAGATESLLPLGAWEELLADNPGLADVEPDVEALLVNKTDSGFECFLVPIDACYELVGLIRLKWRGFDGGTEAKEEIATFFAGLRERATPVTEPQDGGRANG